MPKNRLIPLFAAALFVPLIVLAQEVAPRPGSPPPPPSLTPAEPAKPSEAEVVIDEAIEKIKALKAVSADVTQTVKMLGQQFRLSGKYIKAEPHRVHMSLTLSGLGDTTGTMLQICDGKTLWDYSKILDAQSCQRLEITGILKAIADPDCDATLRESIVTRMNLAGPETLLTGLRKTVEFNAKSETALDGKPVWELVGTWKDRESLTATGQPPIPPTAPLPPYVPSLVYVWIGKEDGWPYKVKMSGRAYSILELGKKVQELGPDGRPVGRAVAVSNDPPSEIVLNYENVQFNGTFEKADPFTFQPPSDLRVDDATEKTMAELTATLNELAARKKAEAAKASDNDLPDTLDVPRLAPDSPSVPPTEPK
jgi:outer membrane lipoprotein-sorting protein